MATKSKIEWTEMTWNPVTGCTKISQGCKNCYAERMAIRLQAMGVERYRNGFSLSLHEDMLDVPKKWSSPRVIFVNSMSDLFHEDVPLGFIQNVFETMVDCKHHIFQVLTKRSERMLSLAKKLPWPENIWMGVSVENSDNIHRIEHLKNIPARVRFLSCEPLIGPLDNLQLNNIHWVIVGGESGPRARLMKDIWVESILQQCNKQNVAFFFKQWGGVRKDLTGRMLNGKTYDELPKAAFEHPSADVLFSNLIEEVT